LLFLLCFAPVLFSVFPVRAAGLGLDYTLGFDSRFRLGAWTPLTVVLENQGAPLRGVLEVVVTTGSEYYQNVHATTHAASVDLPAHTRKAYAFSLRIDAFSHPLIMRVKSGGRVVLRRSVNLRPHYVTEPLFLVLGERISPDLFGQLPAGGVPLAPLARLLPRTWYGFEGVGMILMEAAVLSALDQDQAAALAEWVRGGGFVVLCGGWRYEPLLGPQAQRLLPLTVSGLEQVASLKSLAAFAGRPWTQPGPAPVVRAAIQGAEPLAVEDGLPLILQKDLGYGRVIFLAFDPFAPSFSRWAGQARFWERVYGLKPPAGPGPMPLPLAGLEKEMLAELPAGFPSFIWTALFLGVYVVLVGLLLHRIEHTRTRQRLLALGLPLAAAIFSLLCLGLLYARQADRGRSYSRFVHVMIPEDGRPARLEAVVGLYAVRPTFFRVHLARAGFPLRPLGAPLVADQARQDEVLSDEAGGQTLEARMPAWSHRFFYLRGVVDLDLKAEARLGDAGLEVAVDNPTGRAIRGVRLAYDGRLFDFGDVPAGRRLVRRLGQARLRLESGLDTADLKRESESSASDYQERLRQRIERWAFEFILSSVKSRSHPESVALYGWLDEDPLGLAVRPGDASGSVVRLLEWRVPLKRSGTAATGHGQGTDHAG